MKKINIALILVLIFSFTSCNNEKNSKIEKQEKTNIEKSINDFDEKLIEEVVEPLLEIK